jgi:hypothetical protein
MALFILALLASASGGGWYVYTGRVRPFRPCEPCGGTGYRKAPRHMTFPRPAEGLRIECQDCETTGLQLTWAARRANPDAKAKLDRRRRRAAQRARAAR